MGQGQSQTTSKSQEETLQATSESHMDPEERARIQAEVSLFHIQPALVARSSTRHVLYLPNNVEPIVLN
jgi:hypothetical protein